jgi:hypothetical protein
MRFTYELGKEERKEGKTTENPLTISTKSSPEQQCPDHQEDKAVPCPAGPQKKKKRKK